MSCYRLGQVDLNESDETEIIVAKRFWNVKCTHDPATCGTTNNSVDIVAAYEECSQKKSILVARKISKWSLEILVDTGQDTAGSLAYANR